MKHAIFVMLIIACASVAQADQPVMSKMPRWSEGYGFQFVQEYRHKSDLLLGSEKVGKGLTENVHILNIEGVYTWERWMAIFRNKRIVDLEI